MDGLDLVACLGGVDLVPAVSLMPAARTEIHFESAKQSLDDGAAAVLLIIWIQSLCEQLLEQLDSFTAVCVSQHIANPRIARIQLDLLELEDVEVLVQDGITKG